MHVDPEEFRKHYRELNNEALLSIKRDELSEAAQQDYDGELQKRGLTARASVFEIPELDEPLVTVATYMFPDEAKVARALLQSASIRCYLANEHSLAAVWTWTIVLGGLRLMVPVSQAEEVREILAAVASDEEIETQSAAAGFTDVGDRENSIRTNDHNGRGPRWFLFSAIFFFGAPDPAYLYIFQVFR